MEISILNCPILIKHTFLGINYEAPKLCILVSHNSLWMVKVMSQKFCLLLHVMSNMHMVSEVLEHKLEEIEYV